MTAWPTLIRSHIDFRFYTREATFLHKFQTKDVVSGVKHTLLVIFCMSLQVKHWMDPQLIPYGWGLFSEKEEVILVEQEEEEENTKEKQELMGSHMVVPPNIGRIVVPQKTSSALSQKDQRRRSPHFCNLQR